MNLDAWLMLMLVEGDWNQESKV